MISPINRSEKWSLYFKRVTSAESQIFLRLFYLLDASGDMKIKNVHIHLTRIDLDGHLLDCSAVADLSRAAFNGIYNRGSLRKQLELWQKFDPKNEDHWYEPYSFVSEESKRLAAETTVFSNKRQVELKMHSYPATAPAPDDDYLDSEDEDPDRRSDDEDYAYMGDEILFEHEHVFANDDDDDDDGVDDVEAVNNARLQFFFNEVMRRMN